MTEQEQFVADIMSVSHRIDKDENLVVRILGVNYKLRDTKRWIIDKIVAILYDINYSKSTNKDIRKHLKKVQTGDVRIASYLILNAWAYIPFVHAVHWRYMRMTKTSEVFSGIIEAALDNSENAFFLKGLLKARNLLVSRTQMIQVQE